MTILETISALSQISELFQRIQKLIEAGQLEGWTQDLEKTVNKAEQAKTTEEKRAVTKELVDIVKRLN
ncbi:MAG TPA: hypothetical protein PLS71_25675 [Leptospiraceae bacterium]|nr:hypothetical protein [Leptospiraceae bacterium]